MQQQAEAYPKPSSYSPSYGTAGFRTEASLLPSTVFRSARRQGPHAAGTAASHCLCMLFHRDGTHMLEQYSIHVHRSSCGCSGVRRSWRPARGCLVEPPAS